MIHMKDIDGNDFYYLVNLKNKNVQEFREILHSNS